MIKLSLCYLAVQFLFINSQIGDATATHVKGSFKTDAFFKFLVKFGFQKTDRHSQRDSFGYIFGNITSKYSFTAPITFAVLDRSSFLEFYGNRTVVNKEIACKRMFNRLNYTSYDSKCNRLGQDFFRRVPCEKGKLCPDEDMRWNVVKGFQFTYVIRDLFQPRFWYISMVACYHNTTTCEWHHLNENTVSHMETSSGSNTIQDEKSKLHNRQVIDYDIWLVNGNPNQSSYNPLVYQFSFDQQNTLELQFVFWCCYMVLVPLQLYTVRAQRHPVTRLFTTSLLMEFISLCLVLVHSLRFALDGVGYTQLKTTGDIFDIFSRTSFMLLLLLLAKGWAVTRQELTVTNRLLLMSIWIPYCAFHIVLYIWNRTEVDIISDVDEYQTWPGWLVLASRSVIMLWFLWELRSTMRYEHCSKKLDFLLHFGASSLVWFIYLPVIAIVAMQVSALWRYKLLLGIIYSADCLAYCVMMGLLWPTRSGQYLLLAGSSYAGMEELDEFNEAPHIVHGNGAREHSLPLTDADDTEPIVTSLDHSETDPPVMYSTSVPSRDSNGFSI